MRPLPTAAARPKWRAAQARCSQERAGPACSPHADDRPHPPRRHRRTPKLDPLPGARPEGAPAPSDAPALLLLHANPGDGRDFDAVLPALADRYRTFVVDWPGYGGSTAPEPGRVTPEGLVEVAERVIDALREEQGVREVAVLGNSVGGYVACRLAEGPRAASVTALILVDPAGFTRHSALTRWFCREVMGRPARAHAARRPAGPRLSGPTGHPERAGDVRPCATAAARRAATGGALCALARPRLARTSASRTPPPSTCRSCSCGGAATPSSPRSSTAAAPNARFPQGR
ncbi:alpha/beta fold hydrolase [Streptomyces sp. LN245]|uniref:alpha/beta fold hydrolase n=1 Tax=Streptomyces sp. LN245 TaxID=3112975 RepID=UPI00371DF134